MSVFGTPAPISAQSAIAGATQAERITVKDTDRQRPTRPAAAKRAADEFEHDVSATELADAVRDLKGNDQEEAHEDRREHDGYSASAEQSDAGSPRLDVSA